MPDEFKSFFKSVGGNEGISVNIHIDWILMVKVASMIAVIVMQNLY